MNIEKKQKKNKVIRGIALLGLFLMIFGISYALFRVTLNGNKINRIKSGKMDLQLLNESGETIEEDTIGIENALPISDAEGKALVPYSFTLKNNGTISTEYSITLKDLDLDVDEERLDDKYVTIYMVKGEEYYESKKKTVGETIGPLSLATIRDRIIDAGIIKPGFETSYKLYTWVDISADTGASGKVFKTQLKVDGNQINNTTLSRTIIYRDDATNKNSSMGYNRETDGLTVSQTLYADGTFDVYGSGKATASLNFDTGSFSQAKRYNFHINLLKRDGIDTSSLTTTTAAATAARDLEDEYWEEIWNEYNLDKSLGEEYEYDFIEYADNIKDTNPQLAQKLYYEYAMMGSLAYCMKNNMNISVTFADGIDDILFDGNNFKLAMTLPNNLKRITEIEKCKLDELIIPNTVTSIENKYNRYEENIFTLTTAIFYGTEIEELTIPASVTRVSTKAFSNSKIGKINILGSTVGWAENWSYEYSGIINNVNS